MNFEAHPNALQLLFGEPDVIEVGIVRLDFILKADEGEIYDGFSESYSNDVEQYFSTQITPGSGGL